MLLKSVCLKEIEREGGEGGRNYGGWCGNVLHGLKLAKLILFGFNALFMIAARERERGNTILIISLLYLVSQLLYNFVFSVSTVTKGSVIASWMILDHLISYKTYYKITSIYIRTK